MKLTSFDSIPSGVLYLSVIISQGKLMDPRIYIYIYKFQRSLNVRKNLFQSVDFRSRDLRHG